ncbi:hypothetical protein GCM10023237_57590 [Streptomyces coeruleoprunus]
MSGGLGTGATGTRSGLRIVRLANFVTPSSGGLRTALEELGRGYAAAGHEPVLVVPGGTADDRLTPQGRVITLPAPTVPGTGGYRVLTGRRALRRLLEQLAPDRLEVSDRTTLRWTGEWARRARVPAVMVSHEAADGVLRTWGVPYGTAARAADRLNRRSAWAYSRIVCTTAWAEREFVRIGARNVVRAPLGVDLRRCRPGRRDPALRDPHAGGAEVLLLLCSRLSVEKRPGTALDTLAVLLARGVRAALVVAGDGPLRGGMERRARALGLPVRFLGHVGDREAVADLQAAADVCLAPGPAETFGLSALEALACGTPVVASASSALPEVLGDAGLAAEDDPEAFADAVRTLLARPEQTRRATARARAERFGWDRAVAAFLTAHDAATPAVAPQTRQPGPSPAAARPRTRSSGPSAAAALARPSGLPPAAARPEVPLSGSSPAAAQPQAGIAGPSPAAVAPQGWASEPLPVSAAQLPRPGLPPAAPRPEVRLSGPSPAAAPTDVRSYGPLAPAGAAQLPRPGLPPAAPRRQGEPSGSLPTAASAEVRSPGPAPAAVAPLVRPSGLPPAAARPEVPLSGSSPAADRPQAGIAGPSPAAVAPQGWASEPLPVSAAQLPRPGLPPAAPRPEVRPSGALPAVAPAQVRSSGSAAAPRLPQAGTSAVVVPVQPPPSWPLPPGVPGPAPAVGGGGPASRDAGLGEGSCGVDVGGAV